MSCVGCGMPSRHRLCRDCELAEKYDRTDEDVWDDEDDARPDGGTETRADRDAAVPKHDTPLSYQLRCGACDELMSASVRFCPWCGTRVAEEGGGE